MAPSFVLSTPMLKLTENGLLFPYEAIETTISVLCATFVKSFPMSQTRANLFQEWTKYNSLLRIEIGQDFTQWIDGSFVTGKVNPKDMDIVSFIPYHLYDRHHRVLNNLWSDTWEKEGIDAFLVKFYPHEHPAFELETKPNCNQWARRYSSTKPDELFIQHQKGYLTLIIQ